jgi:hypothetical protein
MKHTRIVFFITLLCTAIASFQIAHTATITVFSPLDHGTGSLRQALADANDGDTIDFAFGMLIDLDYAPLVVDKSVSITGPGPDQLFVLGAGDHRLFYVAPGKTVTISGLYMTNGFSEAAGAAIYNDHSTLTVSNCTVVGSFALGDGGGIYNDGSDGSATLTINNSYLGGTHAYTGKGGAIYNNASDGSATLTIENSTLAYNSAGARGGGIYNDGSLGSATVTITNTILLSNSAGGSGGGLASYSIDPSGSATVTVTNSTLSDNSASLGGGGIDNVADGHGSATLTITNSTLSGNSASSPYSSGGGIANGAVSGGSAILSVTNSTLSGNSGTHGGGIYNATPLGRATLTIGSSILKTGDSGENILSDPGEVISLGYNLSNDDGGGLLTAIGDQINTDPMLGPLQDNGGPTFTHELLSGSPAIDAGDPNFTPPPDYDQRGPGFQRIANGRIDVGAYEVQGTSYAGQIQPPINADETSTFSVRRGVVPVKFNLTLDGVATCDLPPAIIAVTRTAGGVTGQVNESVYGGNADAGSNFRIDNCQYVYNLNARALGAGTYRVDILIDGQVVGSSTFGLN